MTDIPSKTVGRTVFFCLSGFTPKKPFFAGIVPFLAGIPSQKTLGTLTLAGLC